MPCSFAYQNPTNRAQKHLCFRIIFITRLSLWTILQVWRHGISPSQRLELLNRSAFPITETELKLIAAAANIGESKMPKNG